MSRLLSLAELSARDTVIFDTPKRAATSAIVTVIACAASTDTLAVRRVRVGGCWVGGDAICDAARRGEGLRGDNVHSVDKEKKNSAQDYCTTFHLYDRIARTMVGNGTHVRRVDDAKNRGKLDTLFGNKITTRNRWPA